MAATKTSAAKRTGPGPKRKRLLEKRKADERAKNPPPPPKELTGAQARYLRGLGHHLDPVVQIGKDGITDGVVTAVKAALLAHELVKVRLQQEAPIDRKDAGPELAKLTACQLAQVLGRTLLLYKRHPNKPKIVLPKASAATKAAPEN
jgi:RNA-binding protein